MSPSRRDTTSVRLAELMRLVGMLVQRRVGSHLAAGMSPARMRVLSLLSERGRMRMSELAADLDVAPRTITDVVLPLERDSLVTRQPDPDDGRATLVELTEPGRHHAKAAVRAFEKAVSEVFGVLQGPERGQLVELLNSVIERSGGPPPFPHRPSSWRSPSDR
jgi:DNA-binding MarR family transcriptional regulator